MEKIRIEKIQERKTIIHKVNCVQNFLTVLFLCYTVKSTSLTFLNRKNTRKKNNYA